MNFDQVFFAKKQRIEGFGTTIIISVRKAQLTDGLNDHCVHLVWTELQLVAGQTGGVRKRNIQNKKNETERKDPCFSVVVVIGERLAASVVVTNAAIPQGEFQTAGVITGSCLSFCLSAPWFTCEPNPKTWRSSPGAAVQ